MRLVAQFCALLCAFVPLCEISAAADRPNVVLILADDMGYGDLGCYGCPDIRTPNIDTLARLGVRLTSFYANGPECTPTRTGLMTGRYQQRVGGLECALGIGNVGRYDDAIRLANQHDLGLPMERSVLARSLKEAGYATAICGKWHLGYEQKFLPLKHGFDYAFGPLGGAVDYFRHHEPGGGEETMLYQNDQPIKRDGYMTDLIADEACAFLKRVKQPFFLYVPFNAPHSPFQGPKDGGQAAVTGENMNRGSRGKYVEMVEHLDKCVERILIQLEEMGAAKETLVIFTSDNGGPQHSRNEPFSGRKGTTYEGGIRVPCIFYWPGTLKAGGESKQVGITMDLTASILKLAGAKPLTDQPFDGIDIVEHVRQGKADLSRTLFWRQRRGENTWRGVRDGNLKLVSQQTGKKREEWLFDLQSDIVEKIDLAAAQPGEIRRLQGLLTQWEEEVKPAR
jgi:arylsulfatase A-like enzyme